LRELQEVRVEAVLEEILELQQEEPQAHQRRDLQGEMVSIQPTNQPVVVVVEQVQLGQMPVTTLVELEELIQMLEELMELILFLLL
jgi:hypothetical protein